MSSIMFAAAGLFGASCSHTVPEGIAIEKPAQILISCDRQDGLFLPGETAKFTITVLRGGEKVSSGELSVLTAEDGGPGNCVRKKFDLSRNNPVTVTASALAPCFLLCRAGYDGKCADHLIWYRTEEQQEKIRQLGLLPGSPLCAPLNALPYDLPEAEDFDAFWKRTLDKARKLPMDMQLSELKEFTSPECRYYRFSMNTLNDDRVYGFISIPTGTGPFPAIAMFPGKGAAGTQCIDCGWGSAGCIAVCFSVHKYPVPATGKESVKAMRDYEAEHGVSDYWRAGEKDPEKYHFYSVLSGFCRVLDCVTEKLPWDRKHLVMSGSSQGGWMTLAMSALYREKVTALYAGVPACGLAASVRPEKERIYLPCYDGIYFARRITAPALVCTGVNDTSVARPDMVCTMFPLLGSKEKKLEADRGEHIVNPLRHVHQNEFEKRHLGLVEDVPVGTTSFHK